MLQIGLLITLSTASYIVASSFIWRSVQVVGSSMEPTLHNGEFCILNRFAVHYRNPSVGEVVVFKDPADTKLSVKRVIAAPGDTVEIREGSVYVNGNPIREDYLGDGVKTFALRSSDAEPIQLTDDRFYVLGDNRSNSADSREYGPVTRDQILGVLMGDRM